METVRVYDLQARRPDRKSGPADRKAERAERALVEIQQDVCRHVINTEIMMLYGHDVTGYLPPLPVKERPRTSIAKAWDCDNPAVRQLGNVTRRGPRNRHLRGSDPDFRSHAAVTSREERPHTAYCTYVQGVLNTRPGDVSARPQTAGRVLDRANDKKLQPASDTAGLIVPNEQETESNTKGLLPYLVMKEKSRIAGALSLSSSNSDVSASERLKDFPDEAEGRAETELSSDRGTSAQPQLGRAGLRTPRFGVARKTKSGKVTKHTRPAVQSEQLHETISRVVKGDRSNLPDHPPTQVQVYLCSNPQDMVAEKRALETEAYPELREYCQRLGLELHIVDSHLPDLDSTPDDLTYRGRLLEACRRQSVGPNFVLLLGDLYGPATIPLTLTVKEYKILYKSASISGTIDATPMEDCYVLDKNVTPAVYVLQEPSKLSPIRCKELRNILKQGAYIATQIGKFKSERETELATTDLEHLTKEALSKHGVDSSALKCLCFHRKFVGIREDLNNERIADFVDVSFSDGQVEINQTKQDRLESLATLLHGQLTESNMKGYEVSWHGRGIQADNSEHDVYLKQISKDFVEGVKRLINLNLSSWKVKNPHFPLYKQVVQHSRINAERNKVYVPNNSLVEQFKNVLTDKELNGFPIIIQGDQGVGKTAFLSHLTNTAHHLVKKSSCVCIYYQVGLTPESSSISTILSNICQQLSVCYNIDPPTYADSRGINRLSKTFVSTLEVVSKHHADTKPLFILLDDVHKLTGDDRANTFFWLPARSPKNVFFVLSINQTSTDTAGNLTGRGVPRSNVLTVPLMSAEESNAMLGRILQAKGRSISEEQKEMLQLSPETEPLLNKLNATKLLTLKADDPMCEIGKSFEEEFQRHLRMLESLHGVNLVIGLCVYLSITPYGMSEVELEESLLSHKTVILEALEKTKVPQNNLFSHVKGKVTRVLDHLRQHEWVMKRSCFDRHVLTWSNDFLKKLVFRFYGITEDDLVEEYQHLQELYSQETGIWMRDRSLFSSSGPCCVTAQLLIPANKRKLALLPHLSSRSLLIDDEDCQTYIKRKFLCDFQWLLSKLQGSSVRDVLADFELLSKPDLEVDLVHHFLRLCSFGLEQNPHSLAMQLLGTMPDLNASRYPLVSDMIEAAKSWMMDQKVPLLVPFCQCFPSPLDACKSKMWSIADVLLVTEDTWLGVMQSREGAMQIWDMVAQEPVYSLGLQFDKVTNNVFCTPELVLGINAPQTLHIWDIESGFERTNIDLEQLFGDSICSIACQAHTKDFGKIAFTISDDDFNQAFVVLDTRSSKVEFKNDKFDVKDEFFQNAAAFVEVESRTWLIFVNVRSEATDDDKTIDLVKLNTYDLSDGTLKHQINCGSKKFQTLFVDREMTVILGWSDCSFDQYDIQSGAHVRHLAHPNSGLVVRESLVSADGYLVALATTEAREDDVSANHYHGLWVWNVEDGSQSELFTQSHTAEDRPPDKFVIVEELHLAILGTSSTSQLSLWDLPTSTCIHRTAPSTEVLSHLRKSPHPYQIYTCSAAEKVVKLWDFYNIITCHAHDSQNISVLPSMPNGRALSTRSDGIPTPDSILKLSRASSPAKSSKSVRFADELSDSCTTRADEVSMKTSNALLSVPDTLAHGAASLEQDDDITSEVGLGPDQNVDLDAMVGVTMAQFTQDGQFVVTGSARGTPTVWDVRTGLPCLVAAKHADDDSATPWVDLTNEDKYIVGMTRNDRPVRDGWPQQYKLQVWERESGRPHFVKEDGRDTFVTSCVTFSEGDRVLVSVFNKFNTNNKAEMDLLVLEVESLEVVQKLTVYLENLPTSLQLTSDSLNVIVVSSHQSGPTNDLTVYNLEDKTQEFPKPISYEFREGTKYKKYGATANIILRDGVSLAAGLNGDLQLWELTSGEYEGNLYHDSSVKERATPSLHNHGGARVTDLAVSGDGRYLVCGGGDGATTVWDLDSEMMTHSYGGHKDEVRKVAISADNQLVVTAGADCLLYVWPFSGDRPLCLLHIHAVPTDLRLSADRQTVCVIGHRPREDDRLMLFRLQNLPPTPTTAAK